MAFEFCTNEKSISVGVPPYRSYSSSQHRCAQLDQDAGGPIQETAQNFWSPMVPSSAPENQAQAFGVPSWAVTILRSPGLTAEQTTVLGLMPAPPETPGRWWGWPGMGTWWFPALKGVSDVGFWCGYGSIPINTIFSGMNIHLPAILGFTRYQGFDPSPCSRCRR